VHLHLDEGVIVSSTKFHFNPVPLFKRQGTFPDIFHFGHTARIFLSITQMVTPDSRMNAVVRRRSSRLPCSFRATGVSSVQMRCLSGSCNGQTGHTRLNHHLYTKFRISQSEQCPCQTGSQTKEHLLRYQNEYNSFISLLGNLTHR
jgi:hypothetical protein